MREWDDIPLPGLATLPTEVGGNITRDPVKRVVSSSTLAFTDREVTRFQRSVVRSPDCWFWTGAISSPDGYGRFTWQRHGVQRTVLAHRFALLVSGLEIGQSAVAEHHCNEPLCVRVEEGHLNVSTQSENIRYAVRLGRHRGNTPAVGSSVPRVERSRRIRSALAGGWNADRYLAAISGHPEEQLSLF